jgi:hypothetical protein
MRLTTNAAVRQCIHGRRPPHAEQLAPWGEGGRRALVLENVNKKSGEILSILPSIHFFSLSA